MIICAVPFCASNEGTVPEAGKDYGHAINQFMERLWDDDWAFIVDHDCHLETRGAWFRALERAVARFPEAGFFTPMRFPANTRWLAPKEALKSYDVREHRKLGEELAAKYRDQIEDVTDYEKLDGGLPAAGIWLVSKRVWREVGGYKNGFKQENVDYDFHARVRAAGRRVYLLREVYLFHAKGL